MCAVIMLGGSSRNKVTETGDIDDKNILTCKCSTYFNVFSTLFPFAFCHSHNYIKTILHIHVYMKDGKIGKSVQFHSILYCHCL